MSRGKYLILAVLTLILQMLSCEFLSVWAPLYIAVIPLFILIVPTPPGSYELLIWAFFLGLLTDILADGVLGLNATSCTVVAFFKEPLLSSISRYDTPQANSSIEKRKLSKSKFYVLMAMTYTAFFIPYILLDGLGIGIFKFVLFRLLLNIGVNSILAYFIAKISNFGILK